LLSDRLRVYFSVCGLGLGHVFRMLNVAKALGDGVEVLFSAYDEAVEVIRGMGFKCVAVPSIELEMGRDSTVLSSRVAAYFPKKFFTFLRQLGLEVKVLRWFKPDVVVSDSRLSTVVACWLLRVPCFLVANQLNVVLPVWSRGGFWVGWRRKIAEGFVAFILAKLWGRASKIFVPDFPPPLTISIRNVECALRFLGNSVRFIGPILSGDMAMGDVDCFEARRRLGLPLNKRIIYVSANGTRLERLVFLRLIFKVLKRVNEADWYFVVSLGFPNRDPRRILLGSGFEVWNWIPDRKAILSACDVVVSRPGHSTILEALWFRKPLVLIPTPGHSEKFCNAQTAAALGVAKIIEQSEFNYSLFARTIRNILSTSRDSLMDPNIRLKFFKLNGLERLLKEIFRWNSKVLT